MFIFGAIFGFVASFYTWPYHLWRGTEYCKVYSDHAQVVGLMEDGTPITRPGYLAVIPGYGNPPEGSICHYEGGDPFLAVLSGVVVLAVTVCVVGVIFCVSMGLRETIHWRRNRGKCQHCSDYTLDVSTDRYSYIPRGARRPVHQCRLGQFCCAQHRLEHQLAAYPQKRCPNDGMYMTVYVNEGYFAHICPKCSFTGQDNSVLNGMLTSRSLKATGNSSGSTFMSAFAPAFGGVFIVIMVLSIVKP